jgi:hypothetical protein
MRLKETSMSLRTPNPKTENDQESKLESQPTAEPLFHNVESQDGAGTDRAHVIAIWTGLFIVAIMVSQFGRPSHAREAEFLRASAKVAALGRTEHSAPAGSEVATLRIADEKELTPAVYASRKYGLEWQYPRDYVLRKGANANLDLYGHPATESAFASPRNAARAGALTGSVTLATIIIPARVYAGTDFQSAALTVRVNAQISEDACGNFKRPSSDTGDDVALRSSQETVGTIDFAVADLEAADVDDADVAKLEDGAPGVSTQEKFYHVYENQACYEFAMRVSSGALANGPSATHVDKDEVFDRLSEILTSVTIVPVRDAAVAIEAHGN